MIGDLLPGRVCLAVYQQHPVCDSVPHMCHVMVSLGHRLRLCSFRAADIASAVGGDGQISLCLLNKSDVFIPVEKVRLVCAW